jgi:hypothetical protein
MEIDEAIKINKIEIVPAIHIDELRNRTISDLKQKILYNKSSIENIRLYKKNLQRVRERKQEYYNSGILPQITNLFHIATNNLFSPMEKVDQEISLCETEEQIVEDNLKILERQKRMNELARINEWWNENADFFSKRVGNKSLKEFKEAVFRQLVPAIEESEAAFLERAEKLVYNLPTAA